MRTDEEQSLLYYDTDAYGRPLGLDEDAIFSALRSIYAGKGTPKHSENVIERIARVRWCPLKYMPVLILRRARTIKSSLSRNTSSIT